MWKYEETRIFGFFPWPTNILGAKLEYIFPNSNNLAHEAQHVRECILAGKLESPLLPLDETMAIAQIMEEIRKQVGVVYNEDWIK